MKNKKLMYVLLPLVAIIWGLIFYKIYSQIKDKDNNASSDFTLMAEKQKTTLPDTFTLMLNYRDPFQSYSFRNQVSRVKTEGIRREFSQQKNPGIEFIWPDFKYGGLIVNQQKKTKTGLLTFNNQSLLVKEGEINQGYKIVKLFSDSIHIRYNKLRKTIYR